MSRVKKRRTNAEIALIRDNELQRTWALFRAQQPAASAWGIFTAGFHAGWRARALRRPFHSI